MIYCCITKKKPIDVNELDRALAFASVFLEIGDDVCVHILFSKNCNADGYAEWNDYEDAYDIEINSRLSREEIIKTLFHEIVHVKQMYENKFEPDEWTWNGEDCTDMKYDDYPWEIEAYAVEKEMMELYLKTRNT